MRKTLDIDDDLLAAVEKLAKREALSLDAMFSALLRQSLPQEPVPEFGFRPFPKRGGVVTNELIDQLREQAGD